MKQRLKGLLALVLSLTMVFALATNAWAAVKIGNVYMGDGIDPAYYKNGDTTTASGSASDYNAMLWMDGGKLTLTLNNFTMVDNSHYEAISSDQDLTLNLIGDNKITASYGSGAVAVSVTGKLAIEGTGSLNADGTDSGLSASSGVDISGGEVTAKGDKYGIISRTGNVSITGGEVEATGRNSGILANKVTISGGTVTATGSNDYGYGIYALEDNFNGGDITISNGTVTATGGIAGMYADNKATIEGGTVTATGGSAGAGIGADNAITISGADTNVTVGCETGLVADTVSILDDSTVSIDADNTAIDCTTLNMGGNWYQWTDKNGGPYKSNDNQLDATKAAATNTLTIDKISTGGQGTATPQPPTYYPIYIPTVEDEPEKVEAAPTFDGGIASAVVVTILSATGGAWLAKKKD